VPILGILVCFAMMASLDKLTWIRLVVWLVIGLVIYFSYSRTHSHLVTDPRDRDLRHHPPICRASSASPTGKVRDVYSVGWAILLIVATDRISAFDCILPQGIPGKGRVLTQMSLFWFDFLRDVVPNHLITATSTNTPPRCTPSRSARRPLHAGEALPHGARSNASRAAMSPVPAGRTTRRPAPSAASAARRAARKRKLPEPIFTPASKAETGHDENISFEAAAKTVGRRRRRCCAI
jgi:phosphoribosylaminoimidazole-succinocarboxamide synthase